MCKGWVGIFFEGEIAQGGTEKTVEIKKED